MTVRVFYSTDAGAPSLTGQNGSLINVLDAILLNGLAAIGVASLTQSGGLATLVTSTPHNFINDPLLEVIGANEAVYNGERTMTVVDSSTLTFPIDSGAPASATGTITLKKNGGGWSKPFSAANQAAYKTPAGTNERYLQVLDATTNNARIRGYETMSAVTTGSGLFPLDAQVNGGLYFHKSNLTDASARPWVAVVTEKMVMLFGDYDNNVTPSSKIRQALIFGDTESYVPGDLYNTIIIGGTATGQSSNFGIVTNTLTTVSSGHYFARTYDGSGGSYPASKHTDTAKCQGATTLSGGGMQYPAPTDGGLYISPVWLGGSSTPAHLRALLAGVWSACHTFPFVDGDVITLTGDYAGKKLLALKITSGGILLEITNTY